MSLLAGIHILNRSGNRLSYMIYNLSTNKVEQDSHFPTETNAFLGKNESNISLHNNGEVIYQHVLFVIDFVPCRNSDKT